MAFLSTNFPICVFQSEIFKRHFPFVFENMHQNLNSVNKSFTFKKIH